MDQNKFITTHFNTHGNYDFILKDKSNYHTIYIYKFNKNMQIIRYKTDNAILGKTADNKIFIIHAKYFTKSSIDVKKHIQFYEKDKANKALEVNKEYLDEHPYDFTIKIDCTEISEGKTYCNYAIPMFEGYIYSDTVWYLDKDRSLKDFVNTLLAKREEVIKELQKRLNISVEKYNNLHMMYDKLVGDEDGIENN